MAERTSKMLLLIESLVCFVPVTLVTLLYALFLIPMYKSGVGSEPWQAQVAAAFTFLGLALQFCGWKVIAAFLIDGRDGIRDVRKVYLYAIILGAGLVALSGIVVLLMILEFQLPEFLRTLSGNYLALPALIPFAHVMLERLRAQGVHVAEKI